MTMVFPTVYWFCLDSHLSGCVVAIIVVVLFLFSVILTVILIFVYGYFMVIMLNFEIHDVTTCLTSNCNIHIAQYLTK